MELNAPIHVHWEMTNECNLNCIHCYQQNDKIRQTHLDRKNLFIVAKRIIEAGVFQVTLTGGEPFTIKCLPDLIEYFNNNGIVPHITSNGTLIETSTISWLSKVNSTIQISLDSHIPEVHNQIRQHSEAHKLVMNAINLLIENDMKFSLAFCANKQNFRDIEGVINYAIDNNVNILLIGEVLPLYGSLYVKQSLSFSISEYKDFISSIIELKKRYQSQIEIHINSEWGFIFSDEIDHSPCTAMDRDMAILYNGKASPCPFIRDNKFYIGNLLTEDLKSIWKKDTAMKFRSQKHSGCDIFCNYYNICMGGCKATLISQGLPIVERDQRCPLSILQN